MEVEDIFGETVHVFAFKECKNDHTVLCQPDSYDSKCPTCGEILED